MFCRNDNGKMAKLYDVELMLSARVKLQKIVKTTHFKPVLRMFVIIIYVEHLVETTM